MGTADRGGATQPVSLGGVDTLVQHPASLSHRPVEAGARPGAAIVRLSTGLEHVDDLVADITHALDVARDVATSGMRADADLVSAR